MILFSLVICILCDTEVVLLGLAKTVDMLFHQLVELCFLLLLLCHATKLMSNLELAGGRNLPLYVLGACKLCLTPV